MKEEELCRALSNFPITLNDFFMKKQFIKPHKLQVRKEKGPIQMLNILSILRAEYKCYTFCAYLGAI